MGDDSTALWVISDKLKSLTLAESYMEKMDEGLDSWPRQRWKS